MKKIIVLFFALLITSLSTTYAASESILTTTKDLEESQHHVGEVGYNLLNSNGIEKRMIFIFDGSTKYINAGTSTLSRTIVIYRGLYSFLQDDNELAAVLAHEISHGVIAMMESLTAFLQIGDISLHPENMNIRQTNVL